MTDFLSIDLCVLADVTGGRQTDPSSSDRLPTDMFIPGPAPDLHRVPGPVTGQPTEVS